MTTHRTAKYVQGEFPKFTMGWRMAKVRDDARVTRGEMSRRQGVSEGTITNWEHDKWTDRPPTQAALLLYADLRPDLDRHVMVHWLRHGEEIDLADLENPNSWCNSVEQLDLFSLVPQAADVRGGGAVWEFSDHSLVDTSKNAESVASGLVRQLVA